MTSQGSNEFRSDGMRFQRGWQQNMTRNIPLSPAPPSCRPTWSHAAAVLSRCATNIDVRPAASAARLSRISRSVVVSRAEVASSKSSTRGFLRKALGEGGIVCWGISQLVDWLAHLPPCTQRLAGCGKPRDNRDAQPSLPTWRSRRAASPRRSA